MPPNNRPCHKLTSYVKYPAYAWSPPPPCCLTLKKSVVPFGYKDLFFKCKVVNTSRKHCFGMDEVGITIDFPSVYVCCPVVSSLSLFLALFLAALQWDSPHMLSINILITSTYFQHDGEYFKTKKKITLLRKQNCGRTTTKL